MEEHALLLQEAGKNLKVASHMLVQTYPLVRDTKMFFAVAQYVFKSLDCSMAALLCLERRYNRVPAFKDDFEDRAKVFRYHVIDRYQIGREYMLFIQDLHKLVVTHRKSPVVFSRKEKLVICTDGYQMHEITESKLKGYIAKAKEFVVAINGVVSQDGRRNIARAISRA